MFDNDPQGAADDGIGHREAQVAVGLEPRHRADGPDDAREHGWEHQLQGHEAPPLPVA